MTSGYTQKKKKYSSHIQNNIHHKQAKTPYLIELVSAYGIKQKQ